MSLHSTLTSHFNAFKLNFLQVDYTQIIFAILILHFNFQCQKDPQLVDKIMNDLDSNKDNEVDFNEFVVLVAALTVACNDFFEEQLRKKGK